MKITLLGSTGSIGKQTLNVADKHNIVVRALAAYSNHETLAQQARKFKAESICIYDENFYKNLKFSLADTNVKIYTGMDGLNEISSLECDYTVNAIVGMIGLEPTLTAINAKNHIALANKETLVAGGELVMKAAAEKNVKIIPIDSEHSAIFQCLAGNNNPEKIILTASGGPFYGYNTERLKYVTKEHALRHPNWSMGAKITVDSATLMNKGLELIEAVHLFNVKPEIIEVVIHRQSIIHSAVEFADGSIIAQLGVPDMRVPIQYALTNPLRFPSPAKRLSLTETGALTFDKPDTDTFTCLSAARMAIEKGGTAPLIVNSANEEAVQAFLDDKISFYDIFTLVSSAFSEIKSEKITDLKQINKINTKVREHVKLKIKGGI